MPLINREDALALIPKHVSPAMASDLANAIAALPAAPEGCADLEDALRWRFLVQHASLGFDGAPSWNAVIRLPVFDHDDQTITALVDRFKDKEQTT